MSETIRDPTEDEQVEDVLDSVDHRTVVQTQLNCALQNGFISLARERYRDALATYRLEHVISDARTMKSSIHISVEDTSENSKEGKEVLCFKKYDPEMEPESQEQAQGNPDGGLSDFTSDGIRKRTVAKSHDNDQVDRPVKNADSEENVVDSNDYEGNSSVPVMAMPSAELREAIKYFNIALESSMKLASENSRTNNLINSSPLFQ